MRKTRETNGDKPVLGRVREFRSSTRKKPLSTASVGGNGRDGLNRAPDGSFNVPGFNAPDDFLIKVMVPQNGQRNVVYERYHTKREYDTSLVKPIVASAVFRGHKHKKFSTVPDFRAHTGNYHALAKNLTYMNDTMHAMKDWQICRVIDRGDKYLSKHRSILKHLPEDIQADIVTRPKWDDHGRRLIAFTYTKAARLASIFCEFGETIGRQVYDEIRNMGDFMKQPEFHQWILDKKNEIRNRLYPNPLGATD